jgi:sporulation protein YlmC with PRC-barrel domain
MRIDLKQLKSLSVETVSGTKLGHVSDLVFEIDGQMIVQYIVKAHALSTHVLTIGRDQVLRTTVSKMLVEDRVAVDEGKEKKRGSSPEPQPVAMRGE